MDAQPTDQPRRVRHLVCWVLLALAGPVAMYAQFDWITSVRYRGARVAFDDYDLGIYHVTSRWAVNDEVLYKTVPSEYPLVANLMFGATRWAADRLAPFPPGFHGFAWTWMSAAWVFYVGVLRRVAAELPWPAVVLWANPPVLYFTLVRFDVYPAALTLFALLAARRDRHLAAAGWLGLAVAVKGYPLFVLPAFAAFVWRRSGVRASLLAAAVSVAPFVAANAVVYSYAGFDGMAGPYRFHAKRVLDSGGSTYDLADEAFGWAGAKAVVDHRRWATVAQGIAAVVVAGVLATKRRETQFAGLVDAGTVSLVALLSFSLFYSPQYVLWVLPFVSVSRSRPRRVVMQVFLVASLCYFPFAFDFKFHSNLEQRWVDFFLACVLTVTAARLALAGLALRRLLGFGEQDRA